MRNGDPGPWRAGDPLTLRGYGAEHGSLPLATLDRLRGTGRVVGGDVPERVAAPDPQHHLDLLPQFLRPRAIALVHHVDVGDLHDTGLQSLDGVARLGHEHEDRRLRAARDVELGLP